MLLCCTYKLHKIGGAYLVTINLGSTVAGGNLMIRFFEVSKMLIFDFVMPNEQ